jgi:hypothetical protein
MGFVFVFERRPESPCSRSKSGPCRRPDVPGEATWPTQPIPDQAGAVLAPVVHREGRESVPAARRPRGDEGEGAQRAQRGLYTPPSLPRHHLDAVTTAAPTGGSGAWSRSEGEMYIVATEHAVMLRLGPQQRRAHRPAAPSAAARQPDHHARGREEADCRGEGRAGEGARALHVAVRLHAEPHQRHGRESAAVVAAHAYDLNTGEIKWQVPDRCVTPPAGSNSNIPENAAPTCRAAAARDRRRLLVFVATASDPHRPRVRPRQRQGRVENRSADRLGGRARVVRSERPAVHRIPGGRRGKGSSRSASAAPVPRSAARRLQADPKEPVLPRRKGGRGRAGRAGGPPQPPGAYIAYALPR